MEALAKLGIDFKSILLYVVNFGILFFILTYYLYKPALKILDQRRDIIAGSLREAEKLKTELEKKEKQLERERKTAEEKLRQEMEKLNKFTEEKRAELIKDMEIKRAQMLEQTSSEIEQKKSQILKEAEKEIARIIKKTVLYIVHNKVPEKVIEESIEEAWKKTA